MQEGHSDPPVCLPEAGNKGALPVSGCRRTPLSSEMGDSGQDAGIKNSVTSLLDYPKPNSV